jgi:hypothetical protein
MSAITDQACEKERWPGWYRLPAMTMCTSFQSSAHIVQISTLVPPTLGDFAPYELQSFEQQMRGIESHEELLNLTVLHFTPINPFVPHLMR